MLLIRYEIAEMMELVIVCGDLDITFSPLLSHYWFADIAMELEKILPHLPRWVC